MTSPVISTKRALEMRLKSLFSNTPIAYESVSFTPPSEAVYLRTQLVVRPPDDVVIGSRYYRERFSFQVFVIDLPNRGTVSALTLAETIREGFPKGLFLDESGTRIHIWTTPQIAGASIVENRLIVPVLIDVTSEVYSD